VVVKNQAIEQPAKTAPKRQAAKKMFTMRHLWRMALWGATAACALLLAVLTTRSEVGSERVAAMVSSWHGRGAVQVAARPFDAQAETKKLATAVRDLTAENDRLKSRLASLEHNVDDLTGSVTRQIEAVKEQTANSWPADAAPPAGSASIVAPSPPPAEGLDAPLPSPPLAVPSQSPTDGLASGGIAAEYGVDIGSALSIQTLRARWLGIRSAHAQLFEGLTPTVALREMPQSQHVELRLIVGPLPSSAAAAQLCAALAPYRLFCQPTHFDRRQAALQ
jgi:hypothetical protein